jgi:uncharacterized phage-associated protein
MSTTTALDVAEQILARRIESDVEGVTCLKLQKLVYYVLGWTLAIEKRLIFTDPVEAQPFGPMFPTVWANYRNGVQLTSHVPIVPNVIIDAVVSVYGSQNDKVLVARTHRETPWINNYCEDDITVPAIIPTEDVQSYFLGELSSSAVRMHKLFLGAYIDKKFEVVSVKCPYISQETREIVKQEVGIA